jgi:hypothetical protein
VARHSYTAQAKEFFAKTSGTYLLYSMEVGKDINSGKLYTNFLYTKNLFYFSVGMKVYIK